MRLFYIANIRFPTEKAHGAQIAKTCEALMHQGAEVTLVTTDRKTVTETPRNYYRLSVEIPTIRISVPDIVSWGPLGFFIESLVFAWRINCPAQSVIYGRDEWILLVLSYMCKSPIYWESHTGAWNLGARMLARRAAGIVVISEGLRDFYIERGVSAGRMLVAYDGIDLAAFAHTLDKEAARTKLDLPRDSKIVMYVGRFDGWKGSDTFFNAASSLPEDMLAVAIGGEPTQVESLRTRYPEVRFLGFRPYRELADHLAAADILALPNTATDIISARFTSPLKLFAYMASQKPIVASDLPSIREVLDESCGYLVSPDDSGALAEGIRRAVADSEASNKAALARERVEQYTWTARAGKILGMLKSV
ncbi:glycosyltransferase [Candidatus Nomurabacteria bacterium]|nr:glycosyltransferase [Candidatus Nomurabacteria bacterium]